MADLAELIEIITSIRLYLSKPQGDFIWTSWKSQAEALHEIDEHLALLRDGVPSKYLAGIFAPTGLVQEHSISNDWGQEFIDLASQFERATK